MSRRSLLLMAVLLSPCIPAAAQQSQADRIREGELDLSVPESPAFTVLGVSPETVIRPESPRTFASSLLNGVDQNGNFQTGVAIDTAPYMLFAGNKVTLKQYREHFPTRMLARTQVSFATTKGTTDSDQSARLALGFRVTIVDRGDPRRDRTFAEDLGRAASEVMVRLGPVPPKDDKAKAEWIQTVESELEKASAPIREAQKKRSWNRTAWTIGGAPSWISDTGSSNDFSWNGGGVWTSLAYGFEGTKGLEDHAQVILHARYRVDEMVPTDPDSMLFVKQNTAIYGARMRFGSPNVIGSIEGAFLQARPSNMPAENFLRITAGLERRLSSDLWLQLGIGGESGRRENRGRLFILGSFKWGVAKK